MSDSSSSSENHTVLGFPRIIEAQVDLGEGYHTVRTISGCDTTPGVLAGHQWGDTLGQVPEQLPMETMVEGETHYHVLKGRGDHCALQIQGVLGVGGEGYVQLGHQHSLDRAVALKRLINRTDAQQTRRLIAEARLTGSLEHPHIIPVHALVETEAGEALIVMKRVEGHSWENELSGLGPIWSDDQGDLFRRHMTIFLSICQAVEFAHNRGVLHLDVKPENVMLGDFGEVYLVDWGIAQRMSELDSLPDNVISGTPQFMSSEMTISLKRVSVQSDVACLGATLHRVLTGEPRHQGKDLYDVLNAARLSKPYQYPPEMHRELGALLNRACAQRAEDRFSSVHDLRVAVESYLEHRVSIALAQSGLTLLGQLKELSRVTFSSDQPDLMGDFREVALNCRVTFERALEMWGSNVTALTGLDQLRIAWATFELDQQQPRVADAILQRMSSPPSSLTARVSELLTEEENKQLEDKRLRKIEAELSFRSTSNYQQLAIALNGLFWSSCLMAVGTLSRSGVIKMDQRLNWELCSYAGVFVIIGLWFYWALFTDTRWRQRFTAAYLCYIGMVYGLRPLSYYLNITMEQSLVIDGALLAFFNSQLASLIHPRMWWSALICLGCMLGCIHSSYWAFELLALGVLASNLCLALVLGSPILEAE